MDGTMSSGGADAAPQQPRSTRTAMLVGIAIGVLVTLVIGLSVMLVRGDDTTTATTETTDTTTTGTSIPETTLPSGDLRGVVLRMDAWLQSSARARADVVGVVAKVGTSCDLDPSDASNTLHNAEQTREQILGEISALQITGNEQADQLVALLLVAMQNSQHANQHFLAWVQNDYANYWYEHSVYDPSTGRSIGNCPDLPPKTKDWTDANAASSDATKSKQAFVAAYDPVAQQFGVRTWSDTEF